MKRGILVTLSLLVIIFYSPGIRAVETDIESFNKNPFEHVDATRDHHAQVFDIPVEAQIIPVIAVDSDGNPVFDLEKEDIEIFINGKPWEFHFLGRYNYLHPTDSEEGVDNLPKRLNLIIVGEHFVRAGSRDRDWQIIRGLIERSVPGESFMLLVFNASSGMESLVGPTRDKEKLFEVLENPRKYATKTMLGGLWARTSGYQAMKNLKYALKTIPGPKMVYFFDGPRLDRRPLGHFHTGQEVTKALNEGGAMVNRIINYYPPSYLSRGIRENQWTHFFVPRTFDHYQYRATYADNLWHIDYSHGFLMPFERMAYKALGMVFGNPDPEMIVENIIHTNAAYYELGLSLGEIKKKKFKISVKCRRPGVFLHSLNHSERQRAYRRMPKLQKKAIAVDIAADGVSKRLMKNVETAEFRKIDIKKIKKGHTFTIEVAIPEHLRKKKLDVFLIRFDDQFNRADVEHKKKMAGHYTVLNIKSKKDKKNLYFVIIDPETNAVIYNQV